MSGNGQDNQLPDAVEAADEAQDEEDDFGEFEGFEGGVERMQAQPAPSPWATFPDLLPVQSSPATPADDGQGPSRMSGAPPPDVGQPPLDVVNWPPAGPSHEEQRPMPQQMRVLNPPDVSLGTNQATDGRVTPDNVHDASAALIMDHRDYGLVQVERLSHQLETVEQVRNQLEEQVNRLRIRNTELEQQAVRQQGQIHDLQSRLRHNQETLDQRLSEINQQSSSDWRRDLILLQEEVSAIKDLQALHQQKLEATHQNVTEVKTEVCDRLQGLENNTQRSCSEMENRLSSKLDNHVHQMKEAVESMVQQTAQQLSGNLSQLVCDAVRNVGSGDDRGGGDLLQSIRDELEKHKDQQRRAREEERQRQLTALSSALQAALQHINGAMNNDVNSKDKNKS